MAQSPATFAAIPRSASARGLDYAHKKADLAGEPLHIVHRDISPSNIIVSYSGEVKIAGLQGMSVQILRLARLDKIFQLYPDVSQARLSFRDVK